MPSYNKEPMLRAHALDELEEEQTELTDQEIFYLNRDKYNLFDDLGIDCGAGSEWKLDPLTGVPQGELGLYSEPRFFIVVKEDGYEKLQKIDTEELKPGSKEFWQEVQLGNIFAYPAGKNDPVQLQIYQEDEFSSRKLTCSKPITPDNMPDVADPPQPLSGLASFLNKITFGWAFKKEKAEYDSYQFSKKLTDETLNANWSGRKRLNVKDKDGKTQEEREAETFVAVRKEAKEQEKRDYVYNETKKSADIYEVNTEVIKNILHPQPKDMRHIPRVLKTPPKGTEKVEGLYTEEQFKNLTVFSKEEMDLDKIKLGDKKEPLTAEEFAAVTFFSMWDDEVGFKAKGKIKEMAVDLTAPEAMEYYGFTPQETKHMISSVQRSMYTGDLYMEGFRDNEGDYFKDFTNPARKNAVKAFQDYQNKDKTTLAKLIALGVNYAAENIVCAVDTLSVQDRGANDMSVHLLSLMEKDPELKQLALNAGMVPEKLEVVKGLKEMNSIDRAARKAALEIAETLKDKKPELSREKKLELAKKIVKERLTEHQLLTEIAENEKDYKEIKETINKNTVDGGIQVKTVWNAEPEKRPKPPKGKIYDDTVTDIIGGLPAVRGKMPQCVKDYGTEKGQQDLDRLAEQICEDQKFAEMSTEELSKKLLKINGRFNINILEASKKAFQKLNAGKQAKEPEQNVQPELNIGNDIRRRNSAVFENHLSI